MNCLKNTYPRNSRLIPFEPVNLYKSVEYSIKKVLILKTKMTFFELLHFLNKLKKANTFGNFKITEQKLSRKKINRILTYLCQENKVIKNKNYFEKRRPSYDKLARYIESKVKLNNLVFLKERKLSKEANETKSFG